MWPECKEYKHIQCNRMLIAIIPGIILNGDIPPWPTKEPYLFSSPWPEWQIYKGYRVTKVHAYAISMKISAVNRRRPSRRLRTVSLSPGLFRLVRHARRESKPQKKSGRVKSWGREAPERKDYLSQRVWIMRCSHNAKIWLTYVGNVDNTLSTFEIRVTSCRNVLSRSLRIEKQIKALELHLSGHNVLAILLTGYGKS